MSGSADPSRGPSPLPPSRQRPRRLGRLPLAIAAGMALCMLLALGWVMIGMAQQQQVAGSVAPDAGSADPDADLLTAAAPDPNLTLAASRMLDPAPSVSTPTSAPHDATPTAQTQRQPDVHEQARLAAWQTYYSNLAAMNDERRRATMEAMRGDLAPQAQAASSPAAGSSGGGGPSIPGLGGAAAGPAPRPGTLDQGPGTLASLYMQTGPVAAQSAYELKAAVSVIPYRLDQNITTGAAGQFSVTVMRHVMDYATGSHILIPQGARIVAVYEDNTGADDERMKVAMTRVIFPPTGNAACPGGEEMPIGSMPGADAMGQAGFHDQVHRHTGRRLFNALIRALGGAGSSVAAMASSGAAQMAAAQLASQGTSAMTQGIRDPGPTFETRAGFPGVLQLTRSIAFDQPWVPGRGFCGSAAGAMVQ